MPPGFHFQFWLLVVTPLYPEHQGKACDSRVSVFVGIGFKSVFLLTSQPYIFSNNYQVRFSDKPCPECDIAYIVPQWVDKDPTVSDIKRIYGGPIPTTCIILPLKPDKVEPVKKELSRIQPELLLFLSKIRRLSVREHDAGSSEPRPIQAVSISSEKDFVWKKSMDAESFIRYLSVDERTSGDVDETECSYYMWRQKFPVPEKNRVDKREEVNEWTITLAFPTGKRLSRGRACPGIYAFIPTEMVTNLPFIIQADFLLQSSREAILWDNIWNQGILDCVPTAFLNAFTSLVKTVGEAPVSSLASMFFFLPIKPSTYQKLNDVRNSIKARILQEDIVPSEVLHSDQRLFNKPCEVARLMPSFWTLLFKAKKQGVGMHSISSHGKYLLSSAFYKIQYGEVLEFLSIGCVDNEWYSKCVRSTNIVLGVDEETYVELLSFVAMNWSSHFWNTGMKKLPLLKYIGLQGKLSLFSIDEITTNGGPLLCRSKDSRYASWLVNSNKDFRCAGKVFFFPKETQVAISGEESLVKWIDQLGVKTLTVYQYAQSICGHMSYDCMLPLAFAHFLCHSVANGYLSRSECQNLCNLMPLVDSCKQVHKQRSASVLVPANGSKWGQLFSSNPWEQYGVFEIQEDYLVSRTFCGSVTPKGVLVDFCKQYGVACDIPDICPPNSALPTVSAPLTKENTFMLLEWIRCLESKGQTMPSDFLKSIKGGSWLRVSVSGSSTYQPPCMSFLSTSTWDDFNEKSCIVIDIPVIDEAFYDNKISSYKEELRTIGVGSGCDEVCESLGRRLMSQAGNSSFTRNQVIAVLNLIRYMRGKYLSPEKLIAVVRGGRLKTTLGDRSPIGSVLFEAGWKSASVVSNIPFIVDEYYGQSIHQYRKELELLGVVCSLKYQFVADNLKPYSSLHYLEAEAFILLLKCIRCCGTDASSQKIISALKSANCLKTATYYLTPFRCFISDPRWGCMLDVFGCFNTMDHHFYGDDILNYTVELKRLGMVVDMEDATEAFLCVFKQMVNSSFLTRAHVLSLLICCRKLKEQGLGSFAARIVNEASGGTWLLTRFGDIRAPRECILYSSQWKSLSRISKLSFIDDGNTGYGPDIHEYKNELKSMGVEIDVEKSQRFVTANICLPKNMSSADAVCLLDCIRRMLNSGKTALPESFLMAVSKNWVKTKFGYRFPKESILFGSHWGSILQPCDGPFIDEEYYGMSFASYSKELHAIGVITDIAYGTALLAGHLKLLSDSNSIKRVYAYLDHCHWNPEDKAAKMIWVPNSVDGSWVGASECVLHNGDGLFSSKLIVLEKRGYEPELLSFFSRAFTVRTHPLMGDYMHLWMEWETSEHKLTHAECCSFWAFVIMHWNAKIEETICTNLTKVPAFSEAEDGIPLIDKCNVFVPDDLLLKDLFENSSSLPLFIWTPMPSQPSIPYSRLLDIYQSLGVRKISESVVRTESSLLTGDNINLKPVVPEDAYLKKGLFTLILGFLSGPELRMVPDARHKIVKSLMDVTTYKATEPITMSYTLPLSSGSASAVNVNASRMIRWEKEKAEFLAQKLDKSTGQKGVAEYATYFAQVVSRGLLWEMEEHIAKLEELIKFGFVLDFNDEAIDFYMKSKNLQVFPEDNELLSSTAA